MSKLDLLTIAIVIVCLAALGYLVYKIVNLMNPPEAPTTSIEDSYDANAVDEDTYTDWDDEVDDADSDVDYDDDDAGTSISDDANYAETEAGTTADEDSNFDDSEMDTESDGLAETGTTTTGSGTGDSGAATSSYNDTSSRSTSSGKYMVLAGTFRQRSNADNHAARLRKLGYSNTEVQLFDRGSYAVVLVDRFSSLSQAKSLVGDLAKDGIDALVSTK
ncbi:MAG: SPOR domain-containing protein [Bacteroidota bacterium]